MARAPARSGHHRPALPPPHSARQHRVEPRAPPGRPTLDGRGVLSSPDPLATRYLAAVAAADGGRLRADNARGGAVARPPHVPGRRDRLFDARYPGTARVLWPTQRPTPWLWVS